jgi:hypothetical protein
LCSKLPEPSKGLTRTGFQGSVPMLLNGEGHVGGGHKTAPRQSKKARGLMRKKTRTLASLLGVLLLTGLCVAIVSSLAASRRARQLAAGQADNLPLSAGYKASTGRAGTADPIKAGPPRLAPESQPAAEARRILTRLQELTVAAKLTPEQQTRAGSILRDLEHMHSLAATFPDAEQRRSLHDKLEKQERLAMDAIIRTEQAPAVDSYFSSNARKWE